MERIEHFDGRDVDEARARAASASYAAEFAEHIRQILAFAEKAMPLALPERFAKVLARGDARKFLQLAAIPHPVTLAPFAA